MSDIKTAVLKRMRGTRMSVEEVKEYLVNNYPVTQIAEALAELLFEAPEEFKPVVISQEDFDRHFRIRGVTADNRAEKRGRPRKVVDNGPELL